MMTVEEYQRELESLDRRMAEREGYARECEQNARDARAERTALKIERDSKLHELHLLKSQLQQRQVVDAVVAAKRDAEADRAEAAKIREEMEQKLAALSAVEQRLNAALDKVETSEKPG